MLKEVKRPTEVKKAGSVAVKIQSSGSYVVDSKFRHLKFIGASGSSTSLEINSVTVAQSFTGPVDVILNEGDVISTSATCGILLGAVYE